MSEADRARSDVPLRPAWAASARTCRTNKATTGYRVRWRLPLQGRRRDVGTHQQRQPAPDVLQPDSCRPEDNNYIWVLGTSLYLSKDGGKTFSSDGTARGIHVDHHAMWISPQDGRHVILGNDGGIYVTYDRGENWDHLNHVAIGQFYHVAVGPRRNYRVYGGLAGQRQLGRTAAWRRRSWTDQLRLDSYRRRRRLRLSRRSQRCRPDLLREPGRCCGTDQSPHRRTRFHSASCRREEHATASTGRRPSSSRLTIPRSTTTPATTFSVRSTRAMASRPFRPTSRAPMREPAVPSPNRRSKKVCCTSARPTGHCG